MRNEKKHIDDELLAKWINGNLLKSEEEQVQQWADYAKDNQKTLEDIQRIEEKIVQLKLMESISSEQALQKLKSRIRSHYMKLNQLLNFWQKVAAIIILPLLVYNIYNYTKSDPGQSDVQISWNEIITPHGLHSEFTLPDGSLVWLNGNTRLKYPLQFTQEQRLVELEGEAYFDVVTNKEQPFVVDAGDVQVEAIGTSFNVMAYGDMDQIETALVEGHVNILHQIGGRREKMASLKPGQLAVYDKGNKKLTKTTTYLDKYVGWRKGRLVFKSDPLKEVLLKLERWYLVEFVLIDTISEKYKYTGTFTDKNLQQVLEYIEMTTPIQFKELEIAFDNDSTIRKRIIQVKNR